jgi:histidine ammonia-lyase
MSTVTIAEEPLALEDLFAVVHGARVELADSPRAMIAASRAVVDRALTRNDAVHGLTTQVGHGRDTRLTEEQIRGEQMFLVMSHSGGVGPALPHAARSLLAGSGLLQPGGPKSVQEALSFRVVPQVHGALREHIAATRNAVVTELNAADDNPLVSVPDQMLISNGNFHPMVLAIACAAAALFAELKQLAHRPHWTYRRWTSGWKITTRLRH